jgi:hypothetical protein
MQVWNIRKETPMLKLMIISFALFVCFNYVSFASSSSQKNLCSNGGFEVLGQSGFPDHWAGFGEEGTKVGVSLYPHSGKYALHLASSSSAMVGVNRNNDALIPIRRGIVHFWYKAISSAVYGKNLQVCIIGMNETREKEVQRLVYTVPPESVGDDQWHEAEIEFDFRTRDDAKFIHFAPRLNETTTDKGAGEFLIDDVEVTSLGLAIERFGTEKPIIKVGESVQISLVVKNNSDEEAVNIDGKIYLPEGLNVSEREIQPFNIDKIMPDESVTLSWEATGKKSTTGMLKVDFENLSAMSFLTIADLTKPELTLENKHIRMNFYKTEQGYGVFTIENGATHLQSQMFSRLIYQSDDNVIRYVPIFADNLEKRDGTYIFNKSFRDVDGVTWDFDFIFSLIPDQKWVNVTYQVTTNKKRNLLAFYGPVVYTNRSNRYDAIFSGLEYLENDEISSSTLDIAPPNNMRRVPHPNKITIPLMAVSENTQDGSVITGMMWNAKQKWSKDNDRPSALFASPNWFECMDNYDVMGLFVPSIPKWVKENQTQANTPYILQAGEPIKIEAQLFTTHNSKPDVSATYAIPYWIEKYGLPQPLPLPRVDGGKELEFSLTAYMDTLWVSEKGGWHQTLDWDPWGVSVNPEFTKQLWLAEKLSEKIFTELKSDEYQKRVDFTLEKLGNNVGKEFAFYLGKFDKLYPGYKGMINGLMASQEKDGSWRFDPDQMNANDTMQNQDYHKLGKKGDVEIGLCANKAYTLLKFANMTGDKASLQAGLKALDFMKRFKIPRAAQVWEVPVHTPDILASAHAIQAYLEAYKITEDKAYLDSAVKWAYTGLPFVYLWNNDDMPYMQYASIPVFGATWFTGSWFGVAVQWNGLDYAYALFDLTNYDHSISWGAIAKGLTVSALYQQETAKKYMGLYPDSYNFMDKTTSPWKLSPSLIIRNFFPMIGLIYDPYTAIIRSGDKTIHITSIVPVRNMKLSDSSLDFTLSYPFLTDRFVTIAGLSKPDGVVKDQKAINEVKEFDSVSEGWRYDSQSGLVFMKLKSEAEIINVSIPNPKLRYVPQIPQAIEKIDWKFSRGGVYDWFPANDLDEFNLEDDVIVTESIGNDPYMICNTKVNASEYKSIIIRMKTTKGNNAQLFWSTDTEPIGESTSMHFQIQSDDKFHEYVIPVSQHEKWKGVITSIRIDPTDSSGSKIAIESISGSHF